MSPSTPSKIRLNDRSCWADFMEAIHEACEAVGCRCPGAARDDKPGAWFRGETDSSYQLIPSLFRSFKQPNKDPEWSRARELESDLFFEFAARARELHGRDMSDWDILFTMQHHGAPTRLLDWTEVVGVAIYFAVMHEFPKASPSPVVWVLNPYNLNEESWKCADLIAPENLGWEPYEKKVDPNGEYWTYGQIIEEMSLFGWKSPVAIYPRFKSDRMLAQNGRFTFHGDKHLPLDKCVRKPEAVVRSLPIPKAVIRDAEMFLEWSGLNRATLFPDLDSLSLQLKYDNNIIARCP